jgi:DNA-binding IclR family transcriptional regulator
MPSRHHRTVDRIAAIIEMVSTAPRGLTLADIAVRLDAPKSSIHQLVNGLVATGYVVETDRRYGLGPAPFVLTLAGNRLAAQELDHELVKQLQQHLRRSIAVGIQVGDTLIYIDHAGDDPALEFTARNHSRRSLYSSASGKLVLANLPIEKMDELLLTARHEERRNVENFLAELPEIRRTGLSYNRSATVAGVYSVAAAFCTPAGKFVGAVAALGAKDMEPELERTGRRMQKFLAEHRRGPARQAG